MELLREIQNVEAMEAIFASYAENPNNTLDQQVEYGHATVKAKVKVLKLKAKLSRELESQWGTEAVKK